MLANTTAGKALTNRLLAVKVAYDMSKTKLKGAC